MQASQVPKLLWGFCLDFSILVGPFQLTMFCDSLSCSAAMQNSQMHSQWFMDMALVALDGPFQPAWLCPYSTAGAQRGGRHRQVTVL